MKRKTKAKSARKTPTPRMRAGTGPSARLDPSTTGIRPSEINRRWKIARSTPRAECPS
jgi:hypothetical protein